MTSTETIPTVWHITCECGRKLYWNGYPPEGANYGPGPCGECGKQDTSRAWTPPK